MAQNETFNPLGPTAPPPPPPPQLAPVPPAPPMAAAPPWWMQPPRRSGWLGRVARSLAVLIFVLSIVLNMYLLILISADFGRGFEVITLETGEADQTVALYSLEGILDEQVGGQFAGFVGQVQDDTDVKAVVLRVTSPGGGVSTSDQIHQLVERLKTAGKTVVVSMGGVAASGGYYVSAPADEIIAEPTTVTGSIGVMMGWLVVKGTLEKIGMETVIMKSTNAQGWKDEMSSFQKPDDRQREHLQEILDQVQARFEQVVRDGRGDRLRLRPAAYTVTIPDSDPPEEIRIRETEPFNGKIYLPDEAKALGLIDSIGYQSAAIERAKMLAGLREPKVVRYKPRKGLLKELLTAKSAATLGLNAALLDELQTPRLMMIWKAQ